MPTALRTAALVNPISYAVDLTRAALGQGAEFAVVRSLCFLAGAIVVAFILTLVIFDPERKVRLSAKTLHMKVDYNPYEGREVTGAADTVISRGRVVIDGGKFVGRAGSGAFLKRGARG